MPHPIQLTDEPEVDADDLPLFVPDDGHEVDSGNLDHFGMPGIWLMGNLR